MDFPIEHNAPKNLKSREPIILASTSPRRKEIAEQMGIPFFSLSPPVDETLPASMTRGKNTKKAAEYLAVLKALSTAKVLENPLPGGEIPQNERSIPVAPMQKARFIAAADTLIVFRGKIYGKPETKEEALSFLSAFSGKTHKVYTGLAVYNRETETRISCTSVSRVHFARLTEEEKKSYIESDEWRDAAGAYKIQGTAQRFIKRIEGSYSSIMGLPIFEFYEILKKSGYRF
ncbi:Maf family protein [Treponema sp. HNW]|uniref:Maf family protein n=1 Tax=Treponema sp. HNW TaxID=3116654 RepID=UPI003D117829